MTDSATRTADLRHILGERRREMQGHVHSRIRDGRTRRTAEGRDDLEHCEAASQGDITLALLQMRTETLARIDEALTRLDAGKYGFCFECEGEVSERRLRALPFAVRCQSCEETREIEQRHTRQFAQRRGSLPLFSAGISF